jgi:homoserine kinase type II
MRTLAQLHEAMRTAPAPAAARTAPIANHIPAANVLDMTAPAIAAIRALGLTAAEEQYLRSAERLAGRLHDVADPRLPTRLVHGDFWDNNVYFREAEPVHIGDFDFMGERARIDDMALTMFYAGEHFGRQDATRERLDHLRALVDAFDGGLVDGLSAGERAALPYAIARSPLTFLRDMAHQGRHGLDELRDLRGPEYDWANRMLDSPAWLGAFS